MTIAHDLLLQQGKRPCEQCHGERHLLSDQLRFRPLAGLWLCPSCDESGSEVSGCCNDDTRDPIIAYFGDKPVEMSGGTEGNDQG